MRVEDLVGFDKSLSGGGPLLTLSMGFLNRNNVVVVKKFVEGLFLSFPAGFGHAFGGEETVGVPSGKREGGGLAGEDAISVGLTVGVGRMGTSGRVGVGSGQRLVATDFLVRARSTSKSSGWRASVELQRRNGRRARNQGVSGDARVA